MAEPEIRTWQIVDFVLYLRNRWTKTRYFFVGVCIPGESLAGECWIFYFRDSPNATKVHCTVTYPTRVRLCIWPFYCCCEHHLIHVGWFPTLSWCASFLCVAQYHVCELVWTWIKDTLLVRRNMLCWLYWSALLCTKFNSNTCAQIRGESYSRLGYSMA